MSNAPLPCRLCCLTKPLLKRSHIIPDFMYKGLYDSKHRINKVAPASLLRGRPRIERPRTGEYEADILCNTCDNNILGSYESYAQLLYERKRAPANLITKEFTNSTGFSFTQLVNIDYTRFKLFLLSILWRASISSRPFFKEVKLGPYENNIRKMIFEGNADGQETFPILLISWELADSVPGDY